MAAGRARMRRLRDLRKGGGVLKCVSCICFKYIINLFKTLTPMFGVAVCVKEALSRSASISEAFIRIDRPLFSCRKYKGQDLMEELYLQKLSFLR